MWCFQDEENDDEEKEDEEKKDEEKEDEEKEDEDDELDFVYRPTQKNPVLMSQEVPEMTTAAVATATPPPTFKTGAAIPPPTSKTNAATPSLSTADVSAVTSSGTLPAIGAAHVRQSARFVL